VPKWPLPARAIYRWEYEDKRRWQVRDDEATEQVAARELELWKWAWRTPQAAAWAQPSEKWRSHTIAMWVRTAVICESSEATAADKGSLHRFADQIGFTTAGLSEMGWRVAVDELAGRAAQRGPAPAAAAPRQRRLRAAGDGQQ
jgi:hypothetical protein